MKTAAEERAAIIAWLRDLSNAASTIHHEGRKFNSIWPDDEDKNEKWSERWALIGDLADAIMEGAHDADRVDADEIAMTGRL